MLERHWRPYSSVGFAMVVTMWSLGIVACGGTRRVDPQYPDDSYAAFEKELDGKNVRITLGDGNVHEGRDVRIDSAMTSWSSESPPNVSVERDQQDRTADDSVERVSVPTSDIWKFQTVSHGGGAGKGFLFGLLGGGAFGGILAALNDDPDSDFAIPVFGVLGATIGLVAGAAGGDVTTFEINPELAPVREVTESEIDGVP